jgi:hypothetical protein
MLARDYAQLAAEAGRLELAAQPDERSPVAQTAKLAVFYLRMAGRVLRQAATEMAWQEEQEQQKAEQAQAGGPGGEAA